MYWTWSDYNAREMSDKHIGSLNEFITVDAIESLMRRCHRLPIVEPSCEVITDGTPR